MQNRRNFLTGVLATTSLGLSLGITQAKAGNASDVFTLWQLPSQTGWQMNSYVIQTAGGKLIVIDGGFKEDAGYLKGFLGALGNKVDIWFISHQHIDHVGALTAILNKSGNLKISKIYGSMLDEQWVKKNETESFKTVCDLNIALQKKQKKVESLRLGDVLRLDGVKIEILGIRNSEITTNAINNSSVVMRMSDSQRSILFTGDLGQEGGKKLMSGPYRHCIKADYVQMAHHGQAGVNEDFYKAVNPKFCIWPTPDYLWDNDNGGGKGSGPWKTIEVRNWMNKLDIRKNYILSEGLLRIK